MWHVAAGVSSANTHLVFLCNTLNTQNCWNPHCFHCRVAFSRGPSCNICSWSCIHKNCIPRMLFLAKWFSRVFSVFNSSLHMLHFNFSPCFSFICFTIPLRAYLFPHWPHSSFCCSPTLSSPLLSCDVTLSLTLMYYLMYLYLAIVMYMEPCNFGSFRKMLLWRINMSNMIRLCTLSNWKVKLKVQLKGKVERLNFLARSRNWFVTQAYHCRTRKHLQVAHCQLWIWIWISRDSELSLQVFRF